MSTVRQRTLDIDGMHCEHCVDAVEEALDGIDGVEVQEADIGSATITAETDVSDEQLSAALDEAGYELVG